MTTDKTKEQALFLFQFGMQMRKHMLKVHVDAHNDAAGKFPDNLSPPQIQMMITIKTMEECTISELAESLNVSAPSASTMVDRLVEKSALIRERSKKDRRVVVVQLSESARSQIEHLEKAMLENFMKTIKKIGPELTEDWCNVITRVNKALQEESK